MDETYEVCMVYHDGDEEYYAGASTVEGLLPYLIQLKRNQEKYNIYKVTRALVAKAS